MHILLLSPKGPLYRHSGGIFKKSLRYAPLTLTTLAAYVPEELGATVSIADEGVRDIDLGADADLVGITWAGAACDRRGPAQPLVVGLALFAAGLVIGGLLAAKRVLSCNPFSKGGYDPVR